MARKKQDVNSVRKKNSGRPTLYNDDIAALICLRIATHTCGLVKLCTQYPDLPNPTTIREWRYKYPEFALQYVSSKIIQADLLAEECLDISDDDTQDEKINQNGEVVCNNEFVARSKLRVDTRKWLASKLIPKIYGAAKELEEKTVENAALKSQLLELQDKLLKVNTREF